jgi:hypothetical protein
MLKRISHYRIRKATDIHREYPLFEVLEDDRLLLVFSATDDGVLEIAISPSAQGAILKLDDIQAIIDEGRRLLKGEMAS